MFPAVTWCTSQGFFQLQSPNLVHFPKPPVERFDQPMHMRDDLPSQL